MGKRRIEMNKTQLMEHLIKTNQIRTVSVEKAFMNVKRERFIPKDQKGMAYYDIPLSLSSGQTISAPSIVAKMLELAELKKGMKVLEIGTGSGYNAALLAEIVGEKNIMTMERDDELIKFAKQKLSENGYDIEIVKGDGSLGYEKESPYDRIISTAAAPKIPKAWKDQIVPGGLIVAPVGGRHFYQELIVARKNSNGNINELKHGGCLFVPLIGELGWPEYSEKV